jgi:ABC-2 type transport system ATP-binding protein
MLEISNLTKTYGKVIANDRLSAVVEPNTVALLVGPNGAGKSTLLKCIMGLLRYRGFITVDGLDNKSVEAKRLLGYVPEIPEPYPLLTVGEHMELVARLYNLDQWKESCDALLKRFDMADKKSKLGGELSKGMQQKLSICTALLPTPKYILFDEPLVGLDPYAIKELKIVFRELSSSGSSLLISTHILDTVDDLWDKVIVMKDGGFVADRTKASIEAEGLDLETIFFNLTGHDAKLAADLQKEKTDPDNGGETEKNRQTNEKSPWEQFRRGRKK